MNTLLQLAERCEQVTGPSKSLDIAIADALNLKTLNGMGQAVYLHNSPRGSFAPLRYTASLDAAMMLVPEGHDWIIGRTNSGLTIHAEVGGRGGEFMRFGNSPALALCAAALRAAALRALASVDGRRMAETGTGSGRSPTSAVPEGQTPQQLPPNTGGSHG